MKISEHLTFSTLLIIEVRMFAVPGSPPVNVRARPVSASTVVVQWEEPLQPNGVVKVCFSHLVIFVSLLHMEYHLLGEDNFG